LGFEPPTLFLAVAIASYLVGGFPSAYVFTILSGRGDITCLGSGNVGAMNTLRNAGVRLGVITFAVDALKGIFSVYLGSLAAGVLIESGQVAAADRGEVMLIYPLVGITMAVAGHNYSPFLRLKGGKGIATAFGAVLFLKSSFLLPPVAVALGALLLARSFYIAAVAAFAAAPITFAWQAWAEGLPAAETGLWGLFGALLGVIVISKHTRNLKQKKHNREEEADG